MGRASSWSCIEHGAAQPARCASACGMCVARSALQGTAKVQRASSATVDCIYVPTRQPSSYPARDPHTCRRQAVHAAHAKHCTALSPPPSPCCTCGWLHPSSIPGSSARSPTGSRSCIPPSKVCRRCWLRHTTCRYRIQAQRHSVRGRHRRTGSPPPGRSQIRTAASPHSMCTRAGRPAQVAWVGMWAGGWAGGC